MKKIIISILMLCVSSPDICKAENTDISSIENVVYIDSIEATQGSSITLSICMKNTVPIRGFQFDLYLPEGVTAVKNDKGRYIYSLNPARLPEDDEHTLTLAEQQDGCIRFLCGSLYDENFTGNDGEIVTISLLIDDNMVKGTYPIAIRNIKLTETNISRYYETMIVKTTLTITGVETIINFIENNKKTNVYYDLQGRRVIGEHLGKGVYIRNGRKVFKN